MDGIRQLFEAIRSALTWWITVAPWEQAIRVRFGKKVKLLGSGMHVKFPIIDRIYRQSTRLRVITVPDQTLTTQDGKPLTLALNLGFRIDDLLKLYNNLHDAHGTLCTIVAGEAGDFVARNFSRDVLPSTLADHLSGIVSERFADCGLSEVSISIQTFAFVRTYRFITGEGQKWGHSGEDLDTTVEWNPRRDYY